MNYYAEGIKLKTKYKVISTKVANDEGNCKITYGESKPFRVGQLNIFNGLNALCDT